jgi:hypothetical protein
MLKHIKKIDDCKITAIKDETMYYCSENKLYINKLDNEETKIVELGDIPWKMWFADDKIWLTNNRLEQINKNDCEFIANKLNLMFEKIRIVEIFENNFLRYSVKNETIVSGLYDIKNEQVIFESTIFFGNLYFNGYLIQSIPKLRCLDIKTKEIFFELAPLDLNENFEKVIKIITINESFILCAMSDYSIVKIDVKTKEYKSWKMFDKDYLSHKTLNTNVRIPIYINKFNSKSAKTSTYIAEKQKIIGFEYGVYWEIDLKNDEISFKSLSDVFDRYEVSGCWSGIEVKNEFVYFFSDQAFHHNMDHKFVEFNLNTFEITDSWQLPKGKYRSGFDIWGPTFLNSNTLGAKDQNGDYHIFKT